MTYRTYRTYRISGRTRIPPVEWGFYNPRLGRWLFGEKLDRNDGTGLDFEALEAAEGWLKNAQEAGGGDVEDITIEAVEWEDEEEFD